jgi:hypothetical protein
MSIIECGIAIKSYFRLYLGVAFLHLHMYNKLDSDEKMLRKSLGYIEESLQHLKMKKVSFLGGDSGPLAIAAVLYHKLGQHNDSQKCIQRFALHLFCNYFSLL